MALSRQDIVKAAFRDRARLIAYAWSIVRDEHAAEDLFQDVAALAVEKAQTIRDEDHLAAWARQAIRFRAINPLRDAGRKPATFDPDLLDSLDHAWHQVDALDSAGMTDALRHCLSELTENNRRIVDLRYMQGLSGVDVAAQLGRKVDTVYQALTRIHRVLAGCIRRRLAEETRRA